MYSRQQLEEHRRGPELKPEKFEGWAAPLDAPWRASGPVAFWDGEAWVDPIEWLGKAPIERDEEEMKAEKKKPTRGERAIRGDGNATLF